MPTDAEFPTATLHRITCPGCGVVLQVPAAARQKGIEWMQEHLQKEHAEEVLALRTDDGQPLLSVEAFNVPEPHPTEFDPGPENLPVEDPSDAFTAIQEEPQ